MIEVGLSQKKWAYISNISGHSSCKVFNYSGVKEVVKKRAIGSVCLCYREDHKVTVDSEGGFMGGCCWNTSWGVINLSGGRMDESV